MFADIDTRPTAAWSGDWTEADTAADIGQVWHPEVDILEIHGSLDFDAWVQAADLLESFGRPVLIHWDSAAQCHQGFILFAQAIGYLRGWKRLPVALLLEQGLGHAIEISEMSDVAFSLPNARIGMTAARTVDGELARGWRWSDRLVPPEHPNWKVSHERLVWLRDNTVGPEAAEHMLAILPLCTADEALEVFCHCIQKAPRR